MKNILLVMEHKENERLLKSFLEKKYKVTLFKDYKEKVNCSISIVFIDDMALKKYENELRYIKHNFIPLFIPYLLITSYNDLNFIKKSSDSIIDEIIKTPIDKVEIEFRINSLIKIHKLSKEAEQRYHVLAENSPVGVCVFQNEKIVYANSVMKNIGEKIVGNIVGNTFKDIICEEYWEGFQKEYFKIINQYNKLCNFEVRVKPNENFKWLEIHMSSIIYKGITSILLIATDITERKNREDKIKYLSFHDNLTGLYNRNYIKEKIKVINSEKLLPFSVIMGDINGFKLVNDGFGHEKGDKILFEIGQRLKDLCRKEYIVVRWGGDEFAILLPKTEKEIALKLCERIRKVCKIKIDSIWFSIALGVASKVNPDEELDDIIKTAEENMYRNKLTYNNRNTVIDSLEKALQEKTNETEEHCKRLDKVANKIGIALNLSDNNLDELSLLARLHDIGKVAIDEKILNKPGKLTEDEWIKIKKHPEIGYRIVKSIPQLARVAEAVLSHHERWDGKGYPQGLKGENIPIISRIIALADTYDVMTTKRPYKDALSKEITLEEIKKCSGTQFDPYLTDKFINIMKGF